MIDVVEFVAASGRGLGNVKTYVPLYFQNVLHLNSNVISVLFTILLLGSVLGPLLGGRLSDKAGRRFMLLVFYGSSALTTLFFIVVASPGMPFWLISLALILMGFAVYAESPHLQAYLADEASPAIRDTAFGLYFALAFGVGSVWSAILGWMIDHYGFDAAFLTMAFSYVAAGLLIREKPATEKAPRSGQPHLTVKNESHQAILVISRRRTIHWRTADLSVNGPAMRFSGR